MRLSFLTQFKIDFLLPFTGCRKVLGKMSQSVKIYIQGITIINNHHNKLFTFFQLSEMNGKKVLGKKVLPHSFLSFHPTWLVRFQEKLLHEMFCKSWCSIYIIPALVLSRNMKVSSDALKLLTARNLSSPRTDPSRRSYVKPKTKTNLIQRSDNDRKLQNTHRKYFEVMVSITCQRDYFQIHTAISLPISNFCSLTFAQLELVHGSVTNELPQRVGVRIKIH